MKINLTIQDVLHSIHEQSLQYQRFPYPFRVIIEKAGINFDRLESINPSAIQCSRQFALFVIKYDKMEMDRLSRSWMPGGWFLNKGPAVDSSLEGLEFEVNTSSLEENQTRG